MKDKFSGRVALKNDKWHMVINYKDELGNYKQKWLPTGLSERGNKKEAQKMLDEELIRFGREYEENKGFVYVKGKEGIGFIDHMYGYVESKKSEIGPAVYKTYKMCVGVMERFFGTKLRLRDVTVKHITDFYDYLRNERGNKNITVRHYAILINPAMRNAYRDDLIRKNPCEFVPRIKREKSPKNYFNKDEIEQFFKAIEGNPLEIVYKLETYYGLRRSEVLGLKWSAFDFRNKKISIQHSLQIIDRKVHAVDKLKTDLSTRTLPLLPVIEKLLMDKRQDIERNREIYGRVYNNEFADYVCVNEIGDIIKPDYVSTSFGKILQKNGLKHMRNHDLRHSCASLLVQNKIPMKFVQEWLGHANFNTTADIYSSVDFSAKEESARLIDSIITRNQETETTDKDDEVLKNLLTRYSTEELLSKIKKKDKDFEM